MLSSSTCISLIALYMTHTVIVAQVMFKRVRFSPCCTANIYLQIDSAWTGHFFYLVLQLEVIGIPIILSGILSLAPRRLSWDRWPSLVCNAHFTTCSAQEQYVAACLQKAHFNHHFHTLNAMIHLVKRKPNALNTDVKQPQRKANGWRDMLMKDRHL